MSTELLYTIEAEDTTAAAATGIAVGAVAKILALSLLKVAAPKAWAIVQNEVLRSVGLEKYIGKQTQDVEKLLAEKFEAEKVRSCEEAGRAFEDFANRYASRENPSELDFHDMLNASVTFFTKAESLGANAISLLVDAVACRIMVHLEDVARLKATNPEREALRKKLEYVFRDVSDMWRLCLRTLSQAISNRLEKIKGPYTYFLPSSLSKITTFKCYGYNNSGSLVPVREMKDGYRVAAVFDPILPATHVIGAYMWNDDVTGFWMSMGLPNSNDRNWLRGERNAYAQEIGRRLRVEFQLTQDAIDDIESIKDKLRYELWVASGRP